jgi:hypothetical protein
MLFAINSSVLKLNLLLVLGIVMKQMSDSDPSHIILYQKIKIFIRFLKYSYEYSRVFSSLIRTANSLD